MTMMAVEQHVVGLRAVCASLGNRYPDAALTLNARTFSASVKGGLPTSFQWPYWASEEGAPCERAVNDLEDWVRKILNEDPFEPIEAMFTFLGQAGEVRWVEPRTIFVRVSPFRIEFKGGPTGFEVYRIEDGLIRDLEAQARGNPSEATFCICAGTPGSWPLCTVRSADVLSAVERSRERMECAEHGSVARMKIGG